MSDDGSDAEEIYVAVRKGVYDAIWDVLGSLAIVFFSVLLVTIGLAFVASALQGGGTGALLAGAFGVVLVLVGVLRFLREFDLWPFRRPRTS